MSPTVFADTATASYVGATACAKCHKAEYSAWKKSDHYRSMQVADSESVLGRFDGSTLEFHHLKTRYFQKDQKYWVDTVNQNGTSQTYEVLFTFGYSPLQQYLVATEKGKLQALNVAWDSRTQEQGGQRWFHLQPEEDITPANPFFWSGFYQNWNTRCADCHSTNLQKNYDPAEHRFDTQWSDINVACEACHGPASQHLASMNTGTQQKHHGFEFSFTHPVQWYFNGKDPIAVATGTPANTEMDRCGGCHSRRHSLPTPESSDRDNANYHDRYSLSLLREGLYFGDGQINDEVFVLGSFLQSKMLAKGVTCSNCHAPHTNALKFEGNGVCAQCHLATAYDTPKHHQHPAQTAGAQCVNCHMPSRTYMQVDQRRDHSLKIPQPSVSQSVGSSDACLSCHNDKDSNWSVSAFDKMFAPKASASGDLANTQHQLALQNPLAIRAAQTLLADSTLATIGRATLLSAMAQVPSRVTLESAVKYLADSDPLMRRAALEALAMLPIAQRWAVASPALNDPIRSVRFAAASLLAATRPTLAPPQRAQLDISLNAYRAMLEAAQDMPSNLLLLSNLALDANDTVRAAALLNSALAIEPGNTAARLNLAEIERTRNNIDAEGSGLLKAVGIAPTDANVQHAYGLFLVRRGNTAQALTHLAAATACINANARHAYVYAVALDSQQKTTAAIDTLSAANARWPNQYDLLMTLVLYLDKTGQFDKSYNYISQLSAIAPNSPAVRAYIQRLQQK